MAHPQPVTGGHVETPVAADEFAFHRLVIQDVAGHAFKIQTRQTAQVPAGAAKPLDQTPEPTIPARYESL